MCTSWKPTRPRPWPQWRSRPEIRKWDDDGPVVAAVVWERAKNESLHTYVGTPNGVRALRTQGAVCRSTQAIGRKWDRQIANRPAPRRGKKGSSRGKQRWSRQARQPHITRNVPATPLGDRRAPNHRPGCPSAESPTAAPAPAARRVVFWGGGSLVPKLESGMTTGRPLLQLFGDGLRMKVCTPVLELLTV